MEAKITAQAGDLRCDIGKKSDKLVSDHSIVNVFTNFEPMSQPIFLLELKSSDVVALMADIAFYGANDGGGLSLHLAKDKTEMDLFNVIQGLLNSVELGFFE